MSDWRLAIFDVRCANKPRPGGGGDRPARGVAAAAGKGGETGGRLGVSWTRRPSRRIGEGERPRTASFPTSGIRIHNGSTGGGRSCTCWFRVMSPSSHCCSIPAIRRRQAGCDGPAVVMDRHASAKSNGVRSCAGLRARVFVSGGGRGCCHVRKRKEAYVQGQEKSLRFLTNTVVAVIQAWEYQWFPWLKKF